jgi:hypothetical protein
MDIGAMPVFGVCKRGVPEGINFLAWEGLSLSTL